MATVDELMGLGLPNFLAQRLGHTTIVATASGSSFTDAKAYGLGAYDLMVNSGTGGVVLKSPASVDGYSIGDQVQVTNYTSAAIALYTRNATVIFSAVSVSGSAGFSVQPGQTFTMKPLTATTWALMAIAATSVTAA